MIFVHICVPIIATIIYLKKNKDQKMCYIFFSYKQTVSRKLDANVKPEANTRVLSSSNQIDVWSVKIKFFASYFLIHNDILNVLIANMTFLADLFGLRELKTQTEISAIRVF